MNLKNTEFSKFFMLLVLAVIFSILSYYVPFFSIMVFLSSSMFVILGILTEKKTYLLGAFFFYTLLIFLFSNPLSALFFSLIFCLPNLAMGYFMKKPEDEDSAYLVGTIMMTIGILLSFQLLLSVGKFDFFANIENDFNTSIQQVKDMGLSAKIPPEFTGEKMVEMLKYMFPSTVMLTALFVSIINKHLAIFLLRRSSLKQTRTYKPFGEFCLPNNISLYFFIFWGISYAISHFNLLDTVYVDRVVGNVLNIMIYLLVIQGLAVVIFHINRIKGPMRAILIISALIFIVYISFFLPFIAILDMAFDSRKIRFRRNK